MDTDDIIGLCVFATVLTLLALIAWRAVQGRAPGVVLLVAFGVALLLSFSVAAEEAL